MEIKINRDIREYTEAVALGLSMRQFVCAALAIGTAALLYIKLNRSVPLGVETASWVCALGAAPFALLGFFKYNGLPAEKFLLAWLKSEMTPRQLTFRAVNWYDIRKGGAGLADINCGHAEEAERPAEAGE